MKFRPELPMHDRYEVSHDFLPPEAGMEILTLSRTINAFFRWEFNSCESLVTGHQGAAHRLRQRLPGHRDHLAALLLSVGDHATRVLVGVLRGHRAESRGWTPTSRAWFDVADDPDLNWADKLGRYALMADRYFEADTYREFCSTALASLPEIVYEWITSPEFDGAAGGHGAGDLPTARAREVPGALPRTARNVGRRSSDQR